MLLGDAEIRDLAGPEQGRTEAPMLVGDIRNQIDSVWDDFWSGGLSNPLAVIEQITYLLFIRRLDELHTLEERKAATLDIAMERRIFPPGKDKRGKDGGRDYEDLRWSRFKLFDPKGAGTTIAIARGSVADPVAAIAAWITAADIVTGPLFRSIRKGGSVSAARLSDKSVSNIVKAHAERLGFDPATFAGHSLRAGFLTSAAARGANLFKMAAQSRHKSIDVLRGYVRDAEIFRDHAGTGLL
jgi:hypothetical protein